MSQRRKGGRVQWWTETSGPGVRRPGLQAKSMSCGSEVVH